MQVWIAPRLGDEADFCDISRRTGGEAFSLLGGRQRRFTCDSNFSRAIQQTMRTGIAEGTLHLIDHVVSRRCDRKASSVDICRIISSNLRADRAEKKYQPTYHENPKPRGNDP